MCREVRARHFPHAVPRSIISVGLDRIGRYRVLTELGTGGMGCLHLGRVEGPGGFERLLAIKTLLPHLNKNRHFVEMFLDEARITAMVQHPNVVQTFEVGDDDGRFFIAMEYVNGETLAAILTNTWKADRPLPVHIGAHILSCVAEGLHAAHELRDPRGQLQGVVHRDVSPQNVLVGYDGIVKVADFGIAKAADRLTHTGTGVRKGKAAYMAPEQIRTEAVDRRADIFALGVVLWETTVGKRLFKAHNDFATIERVMRKVVPPPSRFARDYPREIEDVVLRCLERDQNRRYETARQVADDLRRAIAASGRFVGPTELSNLMNDVFPERKAARTELLRMAALENPPKLEILELGEQTANLSAVPSGEDADEFLNHLPEVEEPSHTSPAEAAFSNVDIGKPGLDPAAKVGVAVGVFGLLVAILALLYVANRDTSEARVVTFVDEPAKMVEKPVEPPPPVVKAPEPEPEPEPEPAPVVEKEEPKPKKVVRRRRRARRRVVQKKAVEKRPAKKTETDLFGADDL